MRRSDSPRSLLTPMTVTVLSLLFGALPAPLLAVIYTVGPHGGFGTIQGALNASLDGETTDIRVEGFSFTLKSMKELEAGILQL